MPAPETVGDFLDIVRKSAVVETANLEEFVGRMRTAPEAPVLPVQAAGLLVRDGLLTRFQAELMLRGKHRGFRIGEYVVQDRLGAGGMSNVYLCEHQESRHQVAVKVLGSVHAANPDLVKRFQREAQAIAELDHPNIVRFHESFQDGQLYFYVMEFIDGANLQQILLAGHPLDISRVCHYMRQAAQGLEHIHTMGLVHRDIKPSNLLVDRGGTVKVLDLGLVLITQAESDVLTKTTLGSIDFIAPEQALNSHAVDIRVDVYSLGASFYYLLSGQTPLSARVKRQESRGCKSIRELRPQVPGELAAVLEKMMAFDLEQRFQKPLEVVEALRPWTQAPMPPPTAEELEHAKGKRRA